MGLPGSFLFLDESGDPGRGLGGSSALVVAVLHLDAEHPLSRVIKRVRQRAVKRRPGKRHPARGELKWNLSPPEVREGVLRELVRESALVAGVSAGIVWKRTGGLWGADLVRLATLGAFEAGGIHEGTSPERRIRLTIDGPPSNLSAFFSWLTPVDFPIFTAIKAADSEAVPELQEADFIAGAVASAFVHGEPRYLRVLEEGGVLIQVGQKR